MRLRDAALPLWRAPGILQVGLEPGDSVVLEGVPESLADVVRVLVSPQTRSGLGRLVPLVAPEWIDWLLARLTSGGLLQEVPAQRPTPQPGVVVIGSGALATSLAAALADSGLSRIDRLATAPATADEGTHGAPVHWSRAPQACPAIAIVAAETAEPDRCLTDDLFRANRPHLLVRLEPGNAVVGPLVLPGRTPCVRCHDLRRAHLDRAWPALLAQLCRERIEPHPTLLAWASWTATLQIRALLAGSGPETLGRSLELASGDYVVRARQWPAHPACGCLVPIT